MSIETAAAKLLDVLKANHFKPKGITRRFTVTNPSPPGKPRAIVGSIGEGEEIAVGQEIPIGTNETYAAGEVYEIEGTGDPNDPQWRIIRQLVPRNPPIGANLYAALPAPVWSAIVNPDDGFSNPICLGTGPDLNAQTGANGEPLALVQMLYRTIVPGSYSVYKEHIASVQAQVKATAATGWRNIPSQPIAPSRPIRITLNEALDASETAVDIALPADVGIDELFPGYYVHWRIDGEIMIGKIVSTVLLTILAAGGRGAEGTTAASHASGSQIELLTGGLTVRGMDPGVSTTARVAFVDGHNVAGPPSVANVLTTWQRVQIPEPEDFIVEMRSNGYHLEWGRPLDPDTSAPMTARLFYRVYRNTTNSLNGSEYVVVPRSMGNSTDVAATNWPTDATRHLAYWFGIQVVDAFGNESSVLWEKDDEPPPAPDIDNVTLTPVPGGIQIDISPSDTSMDDPGFMEFVLYRNTVADDTDAIIVHRWRGRHTVYELGNLNAYYYQVSSADWAGNVDTSNLATAGYWQYMRPYYVGVLPDTQFPANGNFDTVNPKASPAWPLWWRYPADITGAGVTVTFTQSGGAYGTKRMVIHFPAGATAASFVDLVSDPFPYNPMRDIFISFLHKESSSGGTAVGYKCYLLAYTTEDASGTPDVLTTLGVNSFTPSTDWDTGGNDYLGGNGNVGYRTARMVVELQASTGAGRAAEIDVSIDNVYATLG